MAENEIPILGSGSAGVLLPEEQGQILTNGVLAEAGTLALAGDSKTTTRRKSKFPIWLGKPTAGPVGEGQRKPVTGAALGQTELNIKKFASIVLFSDEQIEDAQNGDLDVLVDSGVREALAESIDAHLLGRELGTAIDGVFDSELDDSAMSPVAWDSSKADGLQKAVSAAMGKLESNGYGDPSRYGIVLGHGFQQIMRDAREAADGSTNPLYGFGGDPLYGIQRTLSTNLNSTAVSAGTGTRVAFLVNMDNLHVRLRTDVRVKVSNEATIEIAAPDFTDPEDIDEGETVHLFQDNLTAVRYELRIGAMIHDVDRAVVPIRKS